MKTSLRILRIQQSMLVHSVELLMKRLWPIVQSIPLPLIEPKCVYNLRKKWIRQSIQMQSPIQSMPMQSVGNPCKCIKLCKQCKYVWLCKILLCNPYKRNEVGSQCQCQCHLLWYQCQCNQFGNWWHCDQLSNLCRCNWLCKQCKCVNNPGEQ